MTGLQVSWTCGLCGNTLHAIVDDEEVIQVVGWQVMDHTWDHLQAGVPQTGDTDHDDIRSVPQTGDRQNDGSMPTVGGIQAQTPPDNSTPSEGGQ